MNTKMGAGPSGFFVVVFVCFFYLEAGNAN